MDNKFVVMKMDGYVSNSMTQEEAIKKAKEYDKEGIAAYIAPEKEANKMKNNQFNMSNLR